MTGCRKCGAPTPRRICAGCAVQIRAEERARGADPEWDECPTCGGPTSGTGVVCASCRDDGGADDG